MNSKECLEKLKSMPTCSECENYGECFDKPLCNELYNIISKDLDQLEQLEKENQELKEKCKMLEENQETVLTTLETAVQENIKLKKTLNILKQKVELPLENDFDVVNKNDIHLYRLRTKALVNEEEYELLKEILEEK